MSRYNDDSQFPLENIPFGIVSTSSSSKPQAATRLFGDAILIPELVAKNALSGLDQHVQDALCETTLNKFASLGRQTVQQVRLALQDLLRSHQTTPNDAVTASMVKLEDVVYHLPVKVGDFSDFSCSRDHVLNAGEAVMGVRSLPPGFPYFPVGYGGRSSSIIPPGTNVRRPLGQYRTPDGIKFGPSRAVDFELEIACIVGKPSKFTESIDISNADDHIFGFVLLNDWSARDIQGFEMNPLGPFNGKSFGTSVSPWVVTVDALMPFRVEGTKKDDEPASYLRNPDSKPHYGIELGVEIESDGEKTVVCESRAEWLYWSVADMIAHQTINGCPLNAGDILATGTVSGSTVDGHGCLLEITKGGKQPLKLGKNGERTYLLDNDAVRLTGVATAADGSISIGFGECFGTLEASKFSNGV